MSLHHDVPHASWSDVWFLNALKTMRLRAGKLILVSKQATPVLGILHIMQTSCYVFFGLLWFLFKRIDNDYFQVQAPPLMRPAPTMQSGGPPRPGMPPPAMRPGMGLPVGKRKQKCLQIEVINLYEWDIVMNLWEWYWWKLNWRRHVPTRNDASRNQTTSRSPTTWNAWNASSPWCKLILFSCKWEWIYFLCLPVHVEKCQFRLFVQFPWLMFIPRKVLVDKWQIW